MAPNLGPKSIHLRIVHAKFHVSSKHLKQQAGIWSSKDITKMIPGIWMWKSLWKSRTGKNIFHENIYSVWPITVGFPIQNMYFDSLFSDVISDVILDCWHLNACLLAATNPSKFPKKKYISGRMWILFSLPSLPSFHYKVLSEYLYHGVFCFCS